MFFLVGCAVMQVYILTSGKCPFVICIMDTLACVLISRIDCAVFVVTPVLYCNDSVTSAECIIE